MKKGTLTINTDGGARGNPGHAAWAFVVKENGKVLYEESEYMGIATNNQAEYTAVLKAMVWLSSNVSCPRVSFILDSELVTRQLTGVYKIKEEHLRELAAKVKEKEHALSFPVTYQSVRREQNREADALVNETLDNEAFV